MIPIRFSVLGDEIVVFITNNLSRGIVIKGFPRVTWDDTMSPTEIAARGQYNMVLDTIEYLLLVHGQEGTDIASRAYIMGVEETLLRCQHNLGLHFV